MQRATRPGEDVRTAAGPKLALEAVGYVVTGPAGANDTILAGVSFAVPAGHVFTVLGPSGSGKSTLLRTIDRLVEPTGGRGLLDGRATSEPPLRELRRRVGMVFQAAALFEGTVLDNVAYGPRLWARAAAGRGRPCGTRPTSPRQAADDVVRRGVRLAMVPIIDSTKTMGIVCLPGR